MKLLHSALLVVVIVMVTKEADISPILADLITKVNNQTQDIAELRLTVKKLQQKLACPPHWTMYNDRCYFYAQCENKEACTADNSLLECHKIGGNLTRIFSNAENDFIAKLPGVSSDKIKRLFLGGRDDETDNKWLWPDGSKVDFKRWLKNEPNNYGQKEHCMEMLRHEGDNWNDLACKKQVDSDTAGFVCERG